MTVQVIGRVVCCMCEHDGVTVYVPWFVTDEGHDGFVLTDTMIAAARKLFGVSQIGQ